MEAGYLFPTFSSPFSVGLKDTDIETLQEEDRSETNAHDFALDLWRFHCVGEGSRYFDDIFSI